METKVESTIESKEEEVVDAVYKWEDAVLV
jgi:hypothetical protein